MKKLFVLFLLMFLSVNIAEAKDLERKIVENAKVSQVQAVLKDFLDLYKGVITVITFDEKEKKYVVEYNATTLTAEIGISKGTNHMYPKAQFSCQLIQKDNDVIMTVRKVRYSGWFGTKTVFNHQKKFYKELEYQGYIVRDLDVIPKVDK